MQKQDDGYKFNMGMVKLNKKEVQQISDLLSSPQRYRNTTPSKPDCYEESEQIRFQGIVPIMGLNDQNCMGNMGT